MEAKSHFTSSSSVAAGSTAENLQHRRISPTFRSQLYGVLVKNVLLHSRSKASCASLFLAPPLLIGIGCVYVWFLAIYIQGTLNSSSVKAGPILDFPTQALPKLISESTVGAACKSKACIIGFTPDNERTHEIASLAIEYLLKFEEEQYSLPIQFFNNESSLLLAMNSNLDSFYFGCTLTESSQSNFTISMNSNYIPQETNNKPGIFSFSNQLLTNASLYISSGFSTIQNAIQFALSNMTKNDSKVHFLAKLLPAYEMNSMAPLAAFLLSTFEALAFIPFLSVPLFHLCGEKTSKSREFLFVLGLQKSTYWLSWILTLLVPAFYNVIVSLSLKFAFNILLPSDIPFLLCFYLLFDLSGMFFCFAAQSIITSPMVSMSVASTFLTIPVALGSFVPRIKALQSSLCLFSPFTILMAVSDTTTTALAGSPVSSVPRYLLLVILGADCVLYGFIAWYLNEVFTGEFGVSRSFLFLFQKDYWFPPSVPNESPVSNAQCAGCNGSSKDFEVLNGVRYGVLLRGLSKTYKSFGKSDVNAVDSVYAAFARGCITTLLGENGAGKTTIISTLIGLSMPTSGDAIIEGKSILRSMTEIRGNIGVCPQDSLLYPTLTSIEHCYLVARIKGMNTESLSSISEEVLNEVGITENEHKTGRVSTLSGGTKRKLSLALAIIGDPKVVLLDEPSSGLDPLSKHGIWILLSKLKEQQRTIILTTHSMDEADQLSDYIYILKSGKLKCGGSPMFLKTQFGVGYNLHIEKQMSCITSDLVAHVQSIIPEANVVNDSNTVTTIRLPSAVSKKFPQLLKVLENEGSQKLNIGGFGVSLTTLEDVFVKINTESLLLNTTATTTPAEQSETNSTTTTTMTPLLAEKHPNSREESGSELIEEDEEVFQRASLFQQFIITTKIKMLYYKRNLSSLATIILIPLLELGLMLSVGKSVSRLTNGTSSISHSISDYTPLRIPYIVENNSLNVSVVDLSNLIRSLSSAHINFEEYLDIPTLERETLFTGYFPMALIFHSFSIPNKTADITIMYNQSYPGSFVIANNFISTGIISLINSDSPSILFNELPIFTRSISETKELLSIDVMSLLAGIAVAFCVILVACKPIEPLVTERECGFKTQLTTVGLRPIIFALSNIFSSFLTQIPLLLIAFIFIYAFKIEGLLGQKLPAFILAFIFAVVAISSLTILISNFFSKPSTAVSWASLMLMFMAGFPFLIEVLFLFVPKIEATIGTKGIDAIYILCRLLSPYSFLDFIFQLCVLPNDITFFEVFSIKNSTLIPFVMLCVDAFLYSIFVIAYELYQDQLPSPTDQAIPTPKATAENEGENEDEDVSNERKRVENGLTENCSVQCKQLRKKFPKVVAVKNLSFAINSNECFGLLGANSAGKTTAISCILGLLQPTYGKISLGRRELWGSRSGLYANAHLGSCPQSNGLLSYLTGKEHLEYFARLHSNINREQAEKIATRIMKLLGMKGHENKQVKAYSGGTMRKCSTGIALLPGSRVIIMDEPSTGLDVLARRALWNQVKSARTRPGASVLLTTHSMEEAETACTIVAILDHGSLVCIGSVQHLRTKFSEGYTLTIEPSISSSSSNSTTTTTESTSLKNSSFDCIDEIANLVAGEGNKARFLDVIGTRRVYSIGNPKSLANSFSVMEKELEKAAETTTTTESKIKSYAITQASLENVFARVVHRHEQDEI